MKTWPLQEAKHQFTRLIKLAGSKGPQTVTRHGRAAAVVVSADQFKTMARLKESVIKFFSPLKRSGIRLQRQRDEPMKLKC